MNPAEEQKLIEAARSGDRMAIAQLVRAHSDSAYRLARTIVPTKEDAEEVAQDALIKAIRSLPGYRGESRFSVWLYRITYNLSLNRLRKDARKRALQQTSDCPEHEPADATNLLDELNQQDREHYIQEALKTLNEADQVLIRLYYLEELAVKEISKITGLSVSNVKVRLLRSRNKLHLCLSQLLDHELKALL